MSRSNSREQSGVWNTQGQPHWLPKEIKGGIVRDAARFLLSQTGADAIEHLRHGSAGQGIFEYVPGGAPLAFRISCIAVETIDAETSAFLRDFIPERARDTLCLVLLPSLEVQLPLVEGRLWEQPSLQAAILPFYPSDVYAVGRGEVSVPALVEYKLFRRFIVGSADAQTQFSAAGMTAFENALPQSYRMTDVGGEAYPVLDESVLIEHPLLDDITTAIDRGRACLLIGASASGKSILAEQVAARVLVKGVRVEHLNFSRQYGFPAGVPQILFNRDPHQLLCFIVDDLQSNPSGAKYLISLLCMWRRISVALAPSLLAICWPDFGREIATLVEDAKSFSVFPEQVRDKIISNYKRDVKVKDISQISRDYSQDLFLLRLGLEACKRGDDPTPNSLASAIWMERTKGIEPAAAYRSGLVASSLGRYDIPTPLSFLSSEASVSQDVIAKLIEAGLFRRVAEAVSIGHRSWAGLLNNWLSEQEYWREFADSGSRAQSVLAVVLDYLRSSKAGVAIETLRALQARAGFKQESELNIRAATVVEVWRTFSALVERLEEQQLENPSWGKVPSSAMFAAMAFSALGNERLTDQSLAYLRSAWSLTGGLVDIDLSKLATQDDFTQIAQAMGEEDAARGAPNRYPSEDIDIDRMHRTWASGVILCAEAVSLTPKIRLGVLAEAVLRQQEPRSGAFYPERVPWCTARVLLGLAACGKTVQTSQEVQKAVDWLLRDQSAGGARSAGIWKSGTGRWNSDLEATAMVLLALSAAGYNCSDPSLDAAKSFLLASRLQWVLPGQELDGALSLEAYLDTGGTWDHVSDQALQLSRWARGEALWQGALRSSKESLDQSCRVAQIASHLITIGWEAVRADLPALLEALAGTPSARTMIPDSTPASDPIERAEAPADGPDSSLDCLRGLRSISLRDATVVGSYRRYDERVKNDLKDRVSQIKRALSIHSGTHENFLIWAAPGSGKTFLIQEIARELGDAVSYYEINFAVESKSRILEQCDQIRADTKPTLVLFDEADARSDEAWLYENTFTLLDKALTPDARAVFVLIGSKSVSINTMVQQMRSRDKGTDLVDRVPAANRFEIPPMGLEDKIVLMAEQALSAAQKRGTALEEIEKFALFFALTNSSLNTPRQLRDLYQSSVGRMRSDDSRLTYDDLFERGDRRNQEFYAEHPQAARELSRNFVSVRPATT